MTRNRLYAIFFVVFLALYVILTFSLPPDPHVLEKYSLTTSQLRLLSATVVLPVIAIWSAAFYGYISLRNYASLIGHSADGKAIERIASGLFWLALGLPFLSVVTVILNYLVRQNADLRPTVTITQNYLNLALYFASFIFISQGAAIFARYVNKKPNYGEQHVWVIVMIVISVIYTFFIIGRPFFAEPMIEAYYLPNWLILSTLAIPYIYMWYMGLRSAYRIHFYQRAVKGELYRRSLVNLTIGILFIILSSIVLQIITTLSARIDKLSLAPLLALVYLLLIIISIGYVMVAAGANKMKRLEKV